MIEWNPMADLDLPLRLAPTQIRIDPGLDLFRRDETIETTAAILAVMAATEHKYTVMAPNPAGALAWFNRLAISCKYENDGRGITPLGFCLAHAQRQSGHPALRLATEIFAKAWPLANLAIGVTVSDQLSADKALPILAQIPAHRRIVRATLRGPVDLSQWLPCRGCTAGTLAECDFCCGDGYRRVVPDQVIISAEDGPDATPVEIGWLTTLAGEVLAAQTSACSGVAVLTNGAVVPCACGKFDGPSLSIEQWPVCDVCDGAGRVDVVSHSHYHAGEPVGDGYTQNMACPRCPEASGQSRAAMTEIRSEDRTPLICIPGHGTKQYSEGVRWS